MDIGQIEFIFKYMSQEQREILLNRVASANLATNINKDPEFLKEVLTDLGKDYPFIQQFIETV